MKCKKCKTENGYLRLEKQEWLCRKCGTITPIEAYKTKVPMPKWMTKKGE